MREAQAAAVLDHPNVVPVYETGEEGRFAISSLRIATAPPSRRGYASVRNRAVRQRGRHRNVMGANKTLRAAQSRWKSRGLGRAELPGQTHYDGGRAGERHGFRTLAVATPRGWGRSAIRRDDIAKRPLFAGLINRTTLGWSSTAAACASRMKRWRKPRQ